MFRGQEVNKKVLKSAVKFKFILNMKAFQVLTLVLLGKKNYKEKELPKIKIFLIIFEISAVFTEANIINTKKIPLAPKTECSNANFWCQNIL